MKKTEKKPFNISRTNSSQSSTCFLDKSLSNSFDEPSLQILKKPGAFLSKQNTMTQQLMSLKNVYNIFKTDRSQMDQLLKKYSQQNLVYRSEEFTQQAETFLARIASDKKVPSLMKTHFPLHQIFMSICKVFMLNEYEILALACTLDHCGWKVDEVISEEETDNLGDFPISGIDISRDCQRFIMYLLVLTFSVKQYLNEKAEIEPIQAFCENVCKDFHIIFNRWATSPPSLQRFTYSAPELNRKYKSLSLRQNNEIHSHLKDYNLLVENIMALTGTYNSKSRARDLQSTVFTPQITPESLNESKVVYSEGGPLSIKPEPEIEKGISRQGTFESNDERMWEQLSNANNSTFLLFNNPTTISQLSTNISYTKKTHQPMELSNYDPIVKKLKYEASNIDEINNKENNVNVNANMSENFMAENSMSSLTGPVNGDEFFNMNMAPALMKKPSFRLSQLSDDFAVPPPQWNFSLTFSQENKAE